jgi:hypothetical protein
MFDRAVKLYDLVKSWSIMLLRAFAGTGDEAAQPRFPAPAFLDSPGLPQSQLGGHFRISSEGMGDSGSKEAELVRVPPVATLPMECRSARGLISAAHLDGQGGELLHGAIHGSVLAPEVSVYFSEHSYSGAEHARTKPVLFLPNSSSRRGVPHRPS